MDGNIRYIQHGFTWQATQGDHERIFEIGFRSAVRHHPILQHKCIATHRLRMLELQLVLKKSPQLLDPSQPCSWIE